MSLYLTSESFTVLDEASGVHDRFWESPVVICESLLLLAHNILVDKCLNNPSLRNNKMSTVDVSWL